MAVQNTSLAALLLRIENSLPDLSKSERKVAEYIRKNPRGIIDLSVAALADACGVSDPTVVRAYKKLGFSGYEDLKLTLAQATVSRRRSSMRRSAPGIPSRRSGTRCSRAPCWPCSLPGICWSRRHWPRRRRC